MGQVYRHDRRTGRSSYLEPSAAQLAWLREISEAGVLRSRYAGLPWRERPIDKPREQATIPVMRACQDRGWVRSWPGRPEYMLGYYTATWALTMAGRAEVKHHHDRAALARAAGLPNTPRLAKLMEEEA